MPKTFILGSKTGRKDQRKDLFNTGHIYFSDSNILCLCTQRKLFVKCFKFVKFVKFVKFIKFVKFVKFVKCVKRVKCVKFFNFVKCVKCVKCIRKF